MLQTGFEFSSSGSHLTNDPNSFLITSRCLGFPELIQRPLVMKSIKIAQLNVAEGSVGKRGEIMLNWLQNKAIEG